MRLLFLGIAIATLSTPVRAQIGNPAGIDPATPQAAPGMPLPRFANIQDKLFAQLLASGGLAEVELGALAERKGRSDRVKEFGKRMMQDHAKANDELAGLAKGAEIPLPTRLDPDGAAMKEELGRLEGSAFDLTYMTGQIVGHQKAVVLLEYEIGQGQNADLQRFAAKILPVVLAHLESARAAVHELTSITAQR